MSMAGYVIGLGDFEAGRPRGPQDFGESFERTLNRERMPEKVPFRPTRMIVNAFGVNGVEGRFRQACEDTMRVLRDGASSVIA
jgi:FKBP12-rapamycin complex-associated protein